MTRIFLLLLLLFGAGLLQPRTAAAQGCGAECVVLRDEAGNDVGWGCARSQISATCLATVLRCTLEECSNALLTDESGVMLAIADVCEDEPTIGEVPVGAAQALTLSTPPLGADSHPWGFAKASYVDLYASGHELR